MGKSIREAVSERIGKISDDVAARVTDHFVEVEAERRASAIIAGMSRADDMEKQLAKLRPDLVSYDENGKEISSSYSKGRIDERKKLQEKIEKLNKALDKAITKGDMGDLLNLTKGGDGA